MKQRNRIALKIDSPQYFETMAAHYAEFVDQCIRFELPRHVTNKMTEMVVHLRRATEQLRKRRGQ